MFVVMIVIMIIVRGFFNRNVVSKSVLNADFSDCGFGQLLNFSDRSVHHDRFHTLGLMTSPSDHDETNLFKGVALFISFLLLKTPFNTKNSFDFDLHQITKLSTLKLDY